MVQESHDRSIILCTIKWGIMQWKLVYIMQLIIIAGYLVNEDVCQRENMPPIVPTVSVCVLYVGALCLISCTQPDALLDVCTNGTYLLD
jgi:hypothetical protein